MIHKLVILRHGESQGNHENKFCGWIDLPLSETGLKEAEYAGDLIKDADLKPEIMFTSKLTRSIKTGEIILDRLSRIWIDHIKTWKLNERHYGQFQGRNKHEVFLHLNQDKEKYQYIRRNYYGCPPLIENRNDDPSLDERYQDIPSAFLPRGESLEMVIERVVPYFHETILPQLLIRKTVLIVTHGSICRSLIKYLNNVSNDKISDINVPTGIPMVFELDDNGKLVRDYYYLDKELAEKRMEKVKNEGLEKHIKAE
mgnify:CR=1 FL=1|jgi:2,3-bisphosphoglycerate-dependent phosphoglycerate mutase